MKNTTILSVNQSFAQDLGEQIKRILPDTEVFFEIQQENDVIFIDENESLLQDVYQQTKDCPLVFLSKDVEVSSYADVVIKKPIHLVNFLNKLQNNTLFPKVRRKECLEFNEYKVYPLKKEIFSSFTKKTTKLTEKEVNILKYLYQHSNEIVSKENLLENVWGYSIDTTTHTIETHIYRLRQKVEQNSHSQLIITENNGYRLNK